MTISPRFLSIIAVSAALLMSSQIGHADEAAAKKAFAARLPGGTPNTVDLSSDEAGYVRFVRTPLVEGFASPAAQQIAGFSAKPPEEAADLAANLFVQSMAAEFGHPQEVQMSLRKQTVAANRRHVRYQQTVNRLPVFGGEMLVEMTSNLGILSVQNDTLTGDAASMRGLTAEADVLGRDGAEAAALVALREELGEVELTADAGKLVIYAPSVVGNQGEACVAWQFTIVCPTQPFSEKVFVNASTGDVVLRISNIHDAKNRNIYHSNGSSAFPPVGAVLLRSEGGGTSGYTDINEAYDFLGDTYDFYSSVHGRDSINGSGLTLVAYTYHHYSANNAFWYNGAMYFYDGFVKDDVTGHELTHGVTEYTSGLVYLNQSGAINESFSDMWGEWIDQVNGAGTDTAGVKWYMGEDLSIGAIRNMKNPPEFSDPDRMGSPYFYTGSGDSGGVHTNSGVGNKLCYLLTDGGSFNGKTITGLGYVAAAKLFYYAQVNLLTSSSDYAALGTALYQAAVALGYTGTALDNIVNAMVAVEIVTGTPSVPNAIVFSENLLGNPGWTKNGQWAFGQPTGNGASDGYGYPDPTSGYDGSNVYGINLNGDYNLTDFTVNALVTPAMNLSGITNAQLVFQRWLNMDWFSYCGVYIQASTNGVSWTTLWTNPDYAYTRDSAWTKTTIDMSAFDGQPVVYVRWVHLLKLSYADKLSGWNIDNIQVIGVATPKELTVNILPAAAVTAGAQWQVDGDGTWRNSGTSVTLETDVSHTIEFKTVAGFSPRADHGPFTFASNTSMDLGYAPLISDFNGDGVDDLIYQQNGGIQIANLIRTFTTDGDGTLGTPSGETFTYVSGISNYSDLRVVGAADFDGVGEMDLLCSNPNGQILVAYRDAAGAVTGQAWVSRHILPDWTVQGVGDLDNDGVPDLMLQDSQGFIAVWLLNANLSTKNAFFMWKDKLPTWAVVGTADANLDGKLDAILRNRSTGEVVCWTLNNGVYNGGGSFMLAANAYTTSWKSVGILNYGSSSAYSSQYYLALLGMQSNLETKIVGFTGATSTNTFSNYAFASDFPTEATWATNNIGYTAIASQGVQTRQVVDQNLGLFNLDLPLPDERQGRVVADFNNDGRQDILWQTATGSTGVSYGHATLNTFPTSAVLYSGALTGWTLEAAVDVTGDGVRDLIFHHSSGVFSVWQMNADHQNVDAYLTLAGGAALPTWHIRGVGQLSSDSTQEDLVLQENSGAVAVWKLTGTTIYHSYFIHNGGLGDWKVKAVVDVGGAGDNATTAPDGELDLVLQNAAGDLISWHLNRVIPPPASPGVAAGSAKDGTIRGVNATTDPYITTRIGYRFIANAATTSIRTLIGGGKMTSGDSVDDLVFQTSGIGSAYIWTAISSSPTEIGPIDLAGNVSSEGRTIVGQGDFNKDGVPDIVWQHSSGRVGVFIMSDATTIHRTAWLYDSAIAGWTVEAVADLDGDSYPDLVWNDSEGRVVYWLYKGFERQGSGVIYPNALPGWRVALATDWTGDGRPDILLQHTDGTIACWALKNLAITAGTIINTGISNSYRLRAATDLDRDGHRDLILYSSANSNIRYYGNSLGDSGWFTAAGEYILRGH